jgi:predicted  nucleic acid-binding Zn-ribbon protein
MSQELNNPLSQDSRPNQPSSTPPPRKSTTIYWVVIAVLLGACIYLFISKDKAEKQVATTSEQLQSSEMTNAAVQKDFDAALVRLDELTSKNQQMDAEIKDKNGEVEKLKAEIQAILRNKNATESDLAKARKLIASLDDKTKSYQERIAQLETENTDLNNKNTVLATERDSTVSQNIALKKVGSVLHASNIRMAPIDLRKGGKKENETTKAKRVDLLRITFDIDENRIAESGNKDIYLRISGPDGTPLSNAAYGSGVTQLTDGSSLNYTLAKQVSLQQGQPVSGVTVDWHQGNDYKKGDYQIEIFNEGYKVGSGKVTLK